MPLAYIAVGGVLVFSGVENTTITQVFRSLSKGQAPVAGPQSQLNISTTAAVSGNTNSSIANDALRYQGAGYVWGGAPAQGIGNWDCSSFVNWVVGHDLGMAIPGYGAGSYAGTSHGPTTILWFSWNGARTISRGQCQAGDLVCFVTHMGIAVSGSQFISAEDPARGTRVDAIDGFMAEPMLIRRLA